MKLLFVYNADSGKLNTMIDIGHKIISPSTYKCSLCSLTHGALKEKQEWKQFRENADLDLEFLHKDEFESQYKQDFEYPVILNADGELDVLFAAAEINQCKSVEELISAISGAIDNKAH